MVVKGKIVIVKGGVDVVVVAVVGVEAVVKSKTMEDELIVVTVDIMITIMTIMTMKDTTKNITMEKIVIVMIITTVDQNDIHHHPQHSLQPPQISPKNHSI